MANSPAFLSWSSGKDSSWALHLLRQDPSLEVVGLLTTLSEPYDRVAMHAVRRELLEAQAVAAGLPLRKIMLPVPCSNEAYESVMRVEMERAKSEGITQVAFGDLFLEDIRRYREEQLAKVGMTPIFPLWGMDTAQLAWTMIEAGLKAIITCVDPRVLDASFVGREFDASLLADLPAGVDPCGENGEFHTFAYAGPMFAHSVLVVRGEVVEREGFVFQDLVLDKE